MLGVQDAVETLVTLGKKKGFVTFNDVYLVLKENQADPQRLDKVMEMLESRGIEIIDEDDEE
ncbi:MAG: hypothetical protein EXR99_05580 [Gemmataceae bacterium]|nr:hypothetical protein [Gemmataceae bacterium]